MQPLAWVKYWFDVVPTFFRKMFEADKVSRGVFLIFHYLGMARNLDLFFAVFFV